MAMKTNNKKTWTVEQKINLVIGFTKSGMTKKAYCEKYGLNRDVFPRWQKAYENGTLVANGEKKPIAKAKTTQKQTKSKSSAKVETTAKAKPKKQTAKTVVAKTTVKPRKPFGFWTRKADKKTILSLCAENESYAEQLKDSRVENANLRGRTKDLEKQVAYLQDLVDRMTWSA